jgi:hypothetical protein
MISRIDNSEVHRELEEQARRHEERDRKLFDEEVRRRKIQEGFLTREEFFLQLKKISIPVSKEEPIEDMPSDKENSET